MTISAKDVEHALKTLKRWEDDAKRKKKLLAHAEVVNIRRVIEALSAQKA